MEPRTVLSVAANGVLGALLAPTCAVCERLLDRPLSGCVCDGCWRSIELITPPVCDACGEPLTVERHRLCGTCQSHVRVIDRARAVGHYDGTLREIIHALKYRNRRSVIYGLAERMKVCGADLLADVDALVPVPLHPRREFARGFNQSADLAKLLGVPVLMLLRRIRNTTSQVELPAVRRQANVRDAFRLKRRWFHNVRVTGKRLALIDDVSTTGATLEACARVLKDAGASKVFSLTAARVVSRRLR